MNVDVKRVKIIVTAPSENVDAIRNVLGEAGAGVVGEYSYCTKFHLFTIYLIFQ